MSKLLTNQYILQREICQSMYLKMWGGGGLAFVVHKFPVDILTISVMEIKQEDSVSVKNESRL